MTTKQTLLAECDKGIKRNKLSIKTNAGFAALNLVLAFIYFKHSLEGMTLFHTILVILHVGPAYAAANLTTKWERLKDDVSKSA